MRITSQTTNHLIRMSMNHLRYLGLTCWLCAILGFASSVHAQTSICGPIDGVSNPTNWIPAGNPYIIACDSTVASGKTLTIQPGVIIWIGSNVTLTVNGLVQAVGVPGNRITFQAVIPSQYWNGIQLNYSGATNRFKYCDFQNGSRAISMRVYGADYTMVAEIMNCTFTNCLSAAIYGEAQGRKASDPIGNAYLNPLIKNCVFNNTSNGCVLKIFGEQSTFCCPRYGYCNARMIANLFQNLDRAALFDIGSFAGGGSPIFINNTIVNCRTGIDTRDPWDVRIQDNIFVGCTNAVKKTGTLSLTTSYNDFYANATNFTGYPPSYGQPIIPNCKGTLADLFFNIFENPQFLGTDDFHLAASSPCVDACMPDPAFTDMCFPPSLGTQVPDMGAYGGPDACNWLDTVPKLAVSASISNSNNVVRVSWSGIPRSEYQVQYLTNLALVGTNAWLNFTNGRVLAAEKPNSLVVASTNSQRKVFFRIQSLGRTPGN